MTFQLRYVLWQGFAYWVQANREQLEKKIGLGGYILRSASFEVLVLKGVFIPSLVQPKKKDYTKRDKLNATQICKKPYRVGHHAFRTEARKCSHCATGGLLELASKFNGTYKHIKGSSHWERNVALENVL